MQQDLVEHKLVLHLCCRTIGIGAHSAHTIEQRWSLEYKACSMSSWGATKTELSIVCEQ